MQAVTAFFRRLFAFPRPFLAVFSPVWLGVFIALVVVDLATKKIATDHLSFNLTRLQAERVLEREHTTAVFSGVPQVNIWGENGRLIRFQLHFNDRFIFGLGPSAPILGFLATLTAAVFLLLYRWHNPELGHGLAWLFVFSGAAGNLIDKMFLKSLATREWSLGLIPQAGTVSGVVDFIDCIWFNWQAVQDIPILNMLSLERWPTFNVADSLIVVGIALLLFTMREPEAAENPVNARTD